MGKISTGQPVEQRPASRLVRLFLAGGSPHGIVMADIGNWNGKVLAGPRGRLSELLRRPEAGRTGVYILLGPDPDRIDGQLAYIGEADNIASRMKTHLHTETKDFFERIVFLVCSDEALTKAHVRYLESRLIKLTLEAGGASLTNDIHPDFQRLPEADKADMETFIENARLILPLLGCDLFRRSMSTIPMSENADPGGVEHPGFTFSTAGAHARARETEDGFVVFAGSTARERPSDTFPAGYRALRDKLTADGKLVAGPSAELFTFATDVNFTSPSAAASIVAARSASGPLEWKIDSTNTTYRDWRAARLEV